MKCDCCGKRKFWLESYEDIHSGKETLHICVMCSTLVYKIKDAKKNDQDNEFALVAELENRMSKDSDAFDKWFHNQLLNNYANCDSGCK